LVFNSITFLVFFIIFFQLYWLINNKLSITIRNIFTIVASYLFYGWWDYRFLSLIIISSAADFSIGLFFKKTKKNRQRKMLLISSIIINLGILGVFKYFNFFIDSFTDLLNLCSIQMGTNTLKIVLPVGISFYTFQTLSYTIDIYKRKINPTSDIFSFFAFVAFFPQLVAGPIERASRLLSQFQEKKIFSYEDNVNGLRLILWGLFKKIVIADNFGLLVDGIFDPSNPVSGITTFIGAVFFAIQIYADFSGYSDIAIGISKMLGISLMKNFKTPYFSASFSEYWRRWHISLSTWFRDYLYIPLGGSKGSKLFIYRNIFITFLLSGLWHGANITFLIWGGLHGIALIIEKHFNIKPNKYWYSPIVLFVVVLLYIPFRAENLEHLTVLTQSLFQIEFYTLEFLMEIILDFSSIRFLALLIIFTIFTVIECQLKSLDFSEWINSKSRYFRILLYYLLIITIILLGNFDVKPYFIYFQF
jgi:D-alanyl-lipoteichoic acid acyltransferase DltB (MBOAT superfamily)